MKMSNKIEEIKVRQLSEGLRRKAKEELNENEENIESNLKILKIWFFKHFHKHTIKPLDQWLIGFLRGSKHDLEKAQRKLENYYTSKKTAPIYFANRNPFDQKIQEIINLGVYLPLRQCVDEDSPRVCLVRVSQLCGTEYGLVDLTKIGFMILDILLLEDDNFTIGGQDIVADMKNVGFSILSQWTPNMARKMLTCAQNALTVRIKSLHIINAPRGLKAAMAIFKMFLTAKLKQRIFVYNENYEGMYDYIPKSVLPVEYGGADGNLQELTDYWKTKIETHSDWYTEYDKASEEFRKPNKTATSTPAQKTLQSLEID